MKLLVLNQALRYAMLHSISKYIIFEKNCYPAVSLVIHLVGINGERLREEINFYRTLNLTF